MAVILDPDLPAAEQVGHGGDGFSGVFSAGAHGKNEVAQGKFVWFEDLIGLFHRGCASIPSNSDASFPP